DWCFSRGSRIQALNLVPAIHHVVALEVLVVGDMRAAGKRDTCAGKRSNRFRAPAKLDGGLRGVNGANESRRAAVSECGARSQAVNGEISRPARAIDNSTSRKAPCAGNIEFQAGTRGNI